MTNLLAQLKDSNRGKVRFLSVRAEVQQALEVGYPQRDVWKALHDSGRFPLSYAPFNRYVQRFINGHTAKRRGTSLASSRRPSRFQPPGASSQPPLPRFVYDPTPLPKEDLV